MTLSEASFPASKMASATATVITVSSVNLDFEENKSNSFDLFPLLNSNGLPTISPIIAPSIFSSSFANLIHHIRHHKLLIEPLQCIVRICISNTVCFYKFFHLFNRFMCEIKSYNRCIVPAIFERLLNHHDVFRVR